MAKTADYVSAITYEVQYGEIDIVDDRVHQLKGHQGQIEVANRLRQTVLVGEGKQSEMNVKLRQSENEKTQHIATKQDAYSVLCIPQVRREKHHFL